MNEPVAPRTPLPPSVEQRAKYDWISSQLWRRKRLEEASLSCYLSGVLALGRLFLIEYTYIGTGEHLRQEIKTDWQMGTLTDDTFFVHGGPIEPANVHLFGLSPLKAREFLTHSETQKPIGGGKMLFTFQLAGGTLPANARKSGSVGRLWGYKAHCYVFRAQSGINYWSTRATLTTGCEVAFPYVVESADIVEYWAPSGERNGGTEFNKTPWRLTVASLGADAL